MTIRHAQPVGDSAGVTKTEWVYDIVQSDSAGVRGAIRGETRVDAEGKPVVWDLVLTGQDAYRWQQVGWPAFSYTGPVHRCPASAEGAPTDSDADEKVDAPGR